MSTKEASAVALAGEGSAISAPPAHTIEDIHRAQIDAWNKMDADERLFAAIITRWADNLLPTHRAMGQAGLILLAAACEGIGPQDDGDEETVIAARIHRAAHGIGGCLAEQSQWRTAESRIGTAVGRQLVCPSGHDTG
jgi:hypothetical protein